MTPLPCFRRTGNATCGPLPFFYLSQHVFKKLSKKLGRVLPCPEAFLFGVLSQTYKTVWRHSKSFPTANNGHGPWQKRSRKKIKRKDGGVSSTIALQPGYHSTPERSVFVVSIFLFQNTPCHVRSWHMTGVSVSRPRDNTP